MSSRPNPPFLLTRLALILMLPVVALAQGVEVTGTMPEDHIPKLRAILEGAMKQSPGMIQNDLNVAQAEAGVYLNSHSLWPGVGGNADYGFNHESTTGGATSKGSGFFYNAGVNQPVFQWGALVNQSRIGRISLLMAKRSYAEAYRQLAVVLREQFMSLIQKKMALRNARYSLKLAQSAFDVTLDRLKRGEVALSEKSTVGGNVENATLDLARQEDDFEGSKNAFADLAGMAGISDGDIPTTIPSSTYTSGAAASLLAEFLRENAESTFQAQVYQMQIHEAELGYKIAKVGILPKFGVSAGYSVSNSVTANPGQISQSVVDSLNYSANVSWNIFDGFETRGAKLSALASKRTAQLQLKNYLESTEEQARHLVRIMEISARVQANADGGWSYWQDHIKFQASEVKAGNIPPVAYAQSMADYYNSEYQCMGARSAMYAQWTEFVSLVGRDPALKQLPQSYVRETP